MILKTFLSPLELIEAKWIQNIKGIKSISSTMKYKSNMIDGIKVIDEETLEIVPETYDPSLLYALAKSVPALNPIEEMSDNLIDFRSLPIGIGNYKVVWADRASPITRLVRVGSQTGAPETVDIISGGDLRSFDPDVVMSGLTLDDEFSKRYRITLSTNPSSVSVMDFNYGNEAGQSEDFRRAVSLSINKDFVNQGRPASKPAHELLPELFWGRIGAHPTFNSSEARRIFGTLPKSLRSKKHTILYHGPIGIIPEYIKRIEKCLNDLGMNTLFSRVSINSLGIEEKEASMFIYGALSEFHDPLNMFASYHNNSSRPLQHPKVDSAYSSLFSQAFSAENQLEKSKALEKLSHHFLSKNISVPISENRTVYFVGERVETIGEQLIGSTLDFDEVRMKSRD